MFSRNELNQISSKSSFQSNKIKKTFLYVKNNEDDNFEHDDDVDDEYIDDKLGDWRVFRMNLAESGLPTIPSGTLPTESPDATEMGKKQEFQQQQQQVKNQIGTRPKSVSKQNEKLLQTQNEKLANEYLSSVWAHEIAEPEVGSLVCRLPLEAELYRIDDRNAIGKKLREQLKSPSSAKSWKNNDKSTQDDSGPTESKINHLNSVSFSPLAAQTIHWYKSAQRFIETELHHIVKHAESGRIDPSKLSNESTEFLNLYMDNQETWQEVKLVVARDRQTNSVTTLTINRPLSSKLTESLGQLILFGTSVASSSTGAMTLPQTELLVRFLIAFESKCHVYIGGSQNQSEAAEIIHGIHDLEGCRELAPGTGVYRGGMEAAITGVLKGIYKAEEFRFFVGNESFEDGELERRIYWGKYQSVACARSLALKQCVSLPKPLWNEVLELCGGELKEMSTLELMKQNRVDDYDVGREENDAKKNIDEDFDWTNEDTV